MDKAAYDGLYREHYHAVLGFCRRMLGSSTDAEDAAQEVFMKGYRAFNRYRPDQPFAPWIRAIAGNHCLDLLRRGQRLNRIFDASADVEVEPDPGAGALDTIVAESDARTITRAVESLPDRYRLPIVLAYYAQASYAEIAEELGTTTNHVGVLLLRGREHLRRALEQTSRGALS